MNILKYQDWTLSTAIYPEAGSHSFNEIVYLTFGLCSESGKVGGKLKKIIRGDNVEPEAFVAECGDVLWYLARICDNLGIDLEQLAEYNMGKLEERRAKGTIKGSGDTNEQRIVKED